MKVRLRLALDACGAYSSKASLKKVLPLENKSKNFVICFVFFSLIRTFAPQK